VSGGKIVGEIALKITFDIAVVIAPAKA